MSTSPSAPLELNLQLHDKQGQALLSAANEILYGGAAGGGKSHLMRIAAVLFCIEVPGLQVYLFRRIEGDLVKNHMEGPKGFRSLLAEWVNAGLVRIVEGEIEFWNGSKLYLCHCKDAKDRFKYQGAEIHLLLIDELTHFSEDIYRFLRGRVRMVGLNVPDKYKGILPRIICGSNPGNIGHHWVKKAWVDRLEPMRIETMPPEEGGMRRQYIPAKLDDNPSMTDDDPTYEARLSGLGSRELVKALRDGDWNVIEGAFFDCWDTQRHTCEPFTIPEHWSRIRGGDWGSAKPFAILWAAVVSEDIRSTDGFCLPRGALVVYREWYGSPDDSNKGLKLTAEEVAIGGVRMLDGEAKRFLGILQREEGDEIANAVLDPSAFARDGGPSIAERMITASKGEVMWARADNKRISERGAMGGWDQVRNRLMGESPSRPMVVIFDTCRNLIRTLPALQHDPNRPEDVDTDGEDHAPDAFRYICMSRPWANDTPQDIGEFQGWEAQSLNELYEAAEKKRRRTDDA